jgi:formylglycine-generating enzyme required for sulfatase activity
MLLVIKPNGAPWFYVDAKPVSAGTYREVFAGYDPAAKADAPVINVTYDEARSFATTRGGRLPTTEEWDAAARTPSFSAAEGVYEWIDSPGDQKTVRQRGVIQMRADAKHRDVTFRMAKDL